MFQASPLPASRTKNSTALVRSTAYTKLPRAGFISPLRASNVGSDFAGRLIARTSPATRGRIAECPSPK